MPTYYFMVGIPASGKSTYARSLGCKVVCPDEIRKQHPGWNGDRVFEFARQDIVATLKASEDVVLDATGTIRRFRTLDIGAGKVHADRVVCIWMDVSLETCIYRNEERIKMDGFVKVSASEIERMAWQLAADPPDLSEGFDQIVRVVEVEYVS